MKIHKNIIYNTFRYNSTGKKETLNDILKGTKSILASKNGFKEYISNYTIFTKRPTFKNPYISEYPLLKTESAFLIPINSRNNNSENMKKLRIKRKQKIFFSNEYVEKNKYKDFKEKYNRRFYQFLKLNTESDNMRMLKKKIYENRFKRYNTLFLDFFNKWNDCDSTYNKTETIIKYKNKFNNNNIKSKNINNNLEVNIINFNVKERYFKLNYDENEIFNNNYNEFILKKISDIKVRRNKNYINYIESSFNDSNEKKIYLKLESIKLNFYQKIKDKTQESNGNNFSIYLPLSYVFLFYFNNFNFFQKLLISILYFDKNYKSIQFNDEELYNLLNTIDVEEKENKDEKDIDYLAKFHKGKKSIVEPEPHSLLKGNNKSNMISYDKDLRKTFNKPNNFVNKLFIRKVSTRKFSPKKNNDLKTKIIHSNREINKNILKLENETSYNEYQFIWETPSITYKVKMEMPKIYFLYEDLNYNIITSCEKNLFLYLYKHNFVNWDFYALNYIFSIKSFRAFVLQIFSLNKNSTINNNSKINTINNNLRNLKTIPTDKRRNKLCNLIEEKKTNIKKIENLYISNIKIYNQLSENNESYTFFYTDVNLKNFIIYFNSYNIIIDYKKLNPKIKWEFFLNFKQMQYLNEVSKYEPLPSFLPKILKTNFEYGLLDINFNVFDENFNAKILDDGHKEVCYSHKNNDIKIEINKPYIQMENNFNEKKIEKKELNYKFLQNLNGIQMSEWSKKILILLNADIINKKEELKISENIKKIFLKDENETNISNGFRNLINYKRTSKQKLTYTGNKDINNDDYVVQYLRKFKSKDN